MSRRAASRPRRRPTGSPSKSTSCQPSERTVRPRRGSGPGRGFPRGAPGPAGHGQPGRSICWHASIGRQRIGGAVPTGSNPCRQIRKYRARRRERFLTEAEFRRLGRTMDEMEANGGIAVHAAAGLRLLLLTGCRRNEILTLRWDAIDLNAGEIRLTDSKTGARTVSLSPDAAGRARRHSPDAGQSLRHRRPRRPAPAHPGRPLAEGPRAGRPARRTPARPEAFLRVPGPGAGRDAAGDRPAARPQPGRNNGALRPPGGRLRAAGSRSGFRKASRDDILGEG